MFLPAKVTHRGTLAWSDYMADAKGLTLIQLNMSEPGLGVHGEDAGHSLMAEPKGLGIRFSNGAINAS